MVAESSLDLSVPAAFSRSSIFPRTCSVWPFTPADGSPATCPARYTVSPWTTAPLIRGPALWRVIVIRALLGAPRAERRSLLAVDVEPHPFLAVGAGGAALGGGEDGGVPRGRGPQLVGQGHG